MILKTTFSDKILQPFSEMIDWIFFLSWEIVKHSVVFSERLREAPRLKKEVESFLLVELGGSRAAECVIFLIQQGFIELRACFERSIKRRHAWWESFLLGPIYVCMCYRHGIEGLSRRVSATWKRFQNTAPSAWGHHCGHRPQARGQAAQSVWPCLLSSQTRLSTHSPQQLLSNLWKAESFDLWSSTHFWSFETMTGKQNITTRLRPALWRGRWVGRADSVEWPKSPQGILDIKPQLQSTILMS